MGSDREFIVKGRVFSGLGEGRKFASLKWFRRKIMEMLGFEPYPGTLNLLLTGEVSSTLSELFGKFLGYEIYPEDGYLPGRVYRVLILPDIPGAIVRPCIPNYPKNVVEVIAPIQLREALGLKDGDEVKVKILFE
ncbi:MAG: DUF120 domain-containing protein [Candidatus Bathyarchaeia archaeon]